MKPSYGRVSAEGVFPLAPSLDHVGVLARRPADARLLLDVLQAAPGLLAARELSGIRLGLCSDLVPFELAPAVRGAWDDAAALLVGLGARTVEAPFANSAGIRDVFATIQQAEALRTHRDAGLWPGRQSEYGEDVSGRLAAAEAVTFDAYVAATAAREQIRAEFDRLFDAVDLVLTPVSAAAPLAFGAEELEHLGERRQFRDLVLPLTTPQNLAGLPACAVRAGFDEQGLPIGVQLTGARGAEATVLAAAEAFVAATPELQSRRPVI
jgi:aspartyl-tRNA(Asn)/glutamyl-tRNA(Gln) amidotransferase subunit A